MPSWLPFLTRRPAMIISPCSVLHNVATACLPCPSSFEPPSPCSNRSRTWAWQVLTVRLPHHDGCTVMVARCFQEQAWHRLCEGRHYLAVPLALAAELTPGALNSSPGRRAKPACCPAGAAEATWRPAWFAYSLPFGSRRQCQSKICEGLIRTSVWLQRIRRQEVQLLR